MIEGYYHKAIEMSLLDWFATFAPEPDEASISVQRSYDLNEARKTYNDNYIARSDMEIKCQLRYKWAMAMMKAR